MEQPFDFHRALETGYKIMHMDQIDLDATVILLLKSGRHSTAILQKPAGIAGLIVREQ